MVPVRSILFNLMPQKCDSRLPLYRGKNIGLFVLLSRTQAEQLSKSRKKFLATSLKKCFENLEQCQSFHSFIDKHKVTRLGVHKEH